MNMLAPHLTDFLGNWLPHQRGASPNTCKAYADTFRLLLEFAHARLQVEPAYLAIESLDLDLVETFLRHLEVERGNKPQSRNVRLAAVKSFMRYLQFRVPQALEQIRKVLAIPTKKTASKLVGHLDREETKMLLDSPDPASRMGIRDRAMLHLAVAAGLRVSELVGLRIDAVGFEPDPILCVQGKGRRTRQLVLWKETAEALRQWLAVRGSSPDPELFLNARGRRMTRFGFRYILAKHRRDAQHQCPSLDGKRITPHTLRHTCALNVLRSTGDLRKVALWLGHASTETTQAYLRADPDEKLQILERLLPPEMRRGAFQPSDVLIERLKRIGLCGVDLGPSPREERDPDSSPT